MTGDKRSLDLPSRLSVKRGGKLISKTLGKSSSPPSISAPPKAAVGASKTKKDEVQRHKNSFHDMLRGSLREKDGGHAVSLHVPAAGATQTSQSHGACGNTSLAAEENSLPHQKPSIPQHDRLVELEKALAAAKEETAALKHELERVKQDAQASAEVSRYQAQHHAPSEDAEIRTQIQGEAFEQECEQHQDLINQNHNLRYRLAELQDQLVLQSSSHHPDPPHSELEWNALTLRLHEAEKESHSRLQQLLSLKSSISSLTRTDSQVSDSELAQVFSQLANRVREWVVSNYRRARMSFDGLPDATAEILQSIKANYEEIGGGAKLALYQAIVSCVLMHIFNEPLLSGMPDEGIHAGLRAFSQSIGRVGTESREWSRATIQVIEKCASPATILGWRDQKLNLLASELEGHMLAISSTAITSSARSAFIGILKLATDLKRILCLQKEDYCFVFFDALNGNHHYFDDRAMEPIDDPEYATDDGNELYMQREFAFCVFPCLKKISNDVENIVSKARVCCGGVG